MSKKKTTEEFIKDAIKIHGNKYDYSKVEYHNNKSYITIICPEHGEFIQRADKHLIGQGCPKCGGTEKLDKESFIKRANEIHNNKYDYSKVEYKNNREKVCIICPEHGEFWQDPHNHLKGKGCPYCGKETTKPLKYTTNEFILESNKIHNGKYNYSESAYIGMGKKVAIECPTHGTFYQLPYLHLRGCGCPMCANEENGLLKRENTETFIKRASKIHNNKYDYSKVNYITAKEKVCIICPQHGEFWQSPWKHLKGNGCPKCVHHISKAESEIYEYVKSLLPNEIVEHSNREIICPKELDIYIPSLKIGIEYNGLYWHAKDRHYHIDKTEACKKKGIKLIQIFEDEYINHKEIVLSKIAHLLHCSEELPKIMARKCNVMEIGIPIAREFLEKNHIQGFAKASVHLGTFYNEELIGVMSFREEKGKWELVRFASNNNYVCRGIGGKLFKYFVNHYNPSEIKSFADRRWTINEDNNLYKQLGFKFDSYTPPDYRYFNPNDGFIRHHKFGFRKNALHKKYGLPLSMTESEMTKKLGYIKVYDCGLIKYIWKNISVKTN